MSGCFKKKKNTKMTSTEGAYAKKKMQMEYVLYMGEKSKTQDNETENKINNQKTHGNTLTTSSDIIR